LEFTPPRSADAVTNANQWGKRDGLQQLEQELNGPLESFSTYDPLDHRTTPAAPRQRMPNKPNKRTQEALERKKNWVFIPPEEQTEVPTIESVLGVPEYDKNGFVKKKGTPLERYLENQERRSLAVTNDVRVREEDRSRLPDNLAPQNDSLLADGALMTPPKREYETGLKKFLDWNPIGTIGTIGTGANPEPERNSISGFFGLTTPPADSGLPQKSRLDEFREFYGGGSAASPGSGLGGINVAAPNLGLGSLQGPTPGFGGAPNQPGAPGTFGPLIGSTPLQDLTPKASTPPAIEAPKAPLPSAPFDFKRRSF
jgi:hypothetical protein